MPHLVAILIYLLQIYSYYISGDKSPLTDQLLNKFANRISPVDAPLFYENNLFAVSEIMISPLTAKLFYLNFHSLEVVSR